MKYTTKYTVSEFFDSLQGTLGLEPILGIHPWKRCIQSSEVMRPGLALSGVIPVRGKERIAILGRSEISFLKSLDPRLRQERLRRCLSAKTPIVIVSRGRAVMSAVKNVCSQLGIALFSSHESSGDLRRRISHHLRKILTPMQELHGTLVELFGVGVLIQGDSSIGKSEAALGLIERGHRLISDDLVRVYQAESGKLEGRGLELTQHHLEIRGVGIINVAHLYGAVCIRDHMVIDLIVEVEFWQEAKYYDRIGLETQYEKIMGVKIPKYTLPVRPGRDVVLLIETLALQHRLKSMGYNSAEEFNQRLMNLIAFKQKRRTL